MKGLAYRSLMRFVDEELPGGRGAFLAKIEDYDLARFANQPFLAASWYDVAPVVAMNEVASQMMGQSMADFVGGRARTQAREDLSGVYSFLLRLAAPMAVAKGLPRLTSRYFDWGEADTFQVERRHARAIRTGVPSILRAWYPQVSIPYMEIAIERAGGRDVRIESSSVREGETDGVVTYRQTFDLYWD